MAGSYGSDANPIVAVPTRRSILRSPARRDGGQAPDLRYVK
ncbi:MAG: hypothetical protein V3V47_00045 [Desulfobacteria bacterium]